MKIYQRHIKASNEFVEGLVLGSLGLSRSAVYSASWIVENDSEIKMVITLHAGTTVSLCAIHEMQRTVESFTTLYSVHFGATITLYFGCEKAEEGGTRVSLPV